MREKTVFCNNLAQKVLIFENIWHNFWKLFFPFCWVKKMQKVFVFPFRREAPLKTFGIRVNADRGSFLFRLALYAYRKISFLCVSCLLFKTGGNLFWPKFFGILGSERGLDSPESGRDFDSSLDRDRVEIVNPQYRPGSGSSFFHPVPTLCMTEKRLFRRIRK